MKNKTRKERMETAARNRHKHNLRKKGKQKTGDWLYKCGAIKGCYKPNILAMFKKGKDVKAA